MRAILVSISPEELASFLNGKFGAIFKHSNPRCKLPIDVYLYCDNSSSQRRLHKNRKGWFVNETNAIFINGVRTEQHYNGKIVAKVVLVDFWANQFWWTKNLEIFDEPKDLKEFKGNERFGYRPPRNWRYMEVDE